MNKKAIYENIMRQISKAVKKTLYEEETVIFDTDNLADYENSMYNNYDDIGEYIQWQSDTLHDNLIMFYDRLDDCYYKNCNILITGTLDVNDRNNEIKPILKKSISAAVRTCVKGSGNFKITLKDGVVYIFTKKNVFELRLLNEFGLKKFHEQSPNSIDEYDEDDFEPFDSNLL